MKIPTILSMSVLLAAGCGGDDPSRGGTGSGAPAPAGDHDHPLQNDLGELTIGSHRLRAVQRSPIAPGQETDLDLAFPAGSALPAGVRVWIGVESGVGSRKALFGKEGATTLHGHPEVPDPLPEGSRLWVEIEGAGKGSLALPR